MREKLFLIKEYKPTKKASCASFKLDLRNFCKQYAKNLYFKTIPNSFNIKNLGCLIFGQPDSWAGVGFFIPTSFNSDNNICNIDISIQKERALMILDNLDLIKELLKAGLDKLKEKEIIKDYKELK